MKTFRFEQREIEGERERERQRQRQRKIAHRKILEGGRGRKTERRSTP